MDLSSPLSVPLASPGVAARNGSSLFPAPALDFHVQPVGAASGAPLATQPVVRVLGQNGAVDANFTGNVTIVLTGTGVLSGTAVIAAVAGVATFTNLVITGAGSSQLVATASGRTSVTSNSVTTT